MKLYRSMHAIHLYTSLFLVPWLLLYAISAFFLNHPGLFMPKAPGGDFQFLYERKFTPGEQFPQSPEEQARALLRSLDMAGPHHVRIDNQARAVIIFRTSIAGQHRVVWFPMESRVMVHHRSFSFRQMVNQLHFTIGYKSGYLSRTIWALMVDVLAASILLWVISGIYLWATKKSKRFLGAVSLTVGAALFTVIVFTLSL